MSNEPRAPICLCNGKCPNCNTAILVPQIKTENDNIKSRGRITNGRKTFGMDDDKTTRNYCEDREKTEEA